MYRSFKERKERGNINQKRECKQRENDGKEKTQNNGKNKTKHINNHTHKILNT